MDSFRSFLLVMAAGFHHQWGCEFVSEIESYRHRNTHRFAPRAGNLTCTCSGVYVGAFARPCVCLCLSV